MGAGARLGFDSSFDCYARHSYKRMNNEYCYYLLFHSGRGLGWWDFLWCFFKTHFKSGLMLVRNEYKSLFLSIFLILIFASEVLHLRFRV